MASLRFRAAVQGDLEALMRAEIRGASRAARAGVMAASSAAKKFVTADLQRNGLPARVGGALRRKTSPPRGGDEMAAMSELFSKPFTERNTYPADVLTSLAEGGVATAHGKLMPIATRAAGSKRLDQWDPADIDVIPGRNGQAGRVVIRGTKWVIFWLVPQRRARQRIRLNAAVHAGTVALERIATLRWEQYAARLEERH